MLKLYFDSQRWKDKIVDRPVSSFPYYFKDEWGYNKFTARVITEIERAKFIAPNVCIHEDYGTFPVTNASGGSKILIYLANQYQGMFESEFLGDNCAQLLYDISNEVDCDILLNHLFPFVPEQTAYFPEFDEMLVGRDAIIWKAVECMPCPTPVY